MSYCAIWLVPGYHYGLIYDYGLIYHYELIYDESEWYKLLNIDCIPSILLCESHKQMSHTRSKDCDSPLH